MSNSRETPPHEPGRWGEFFVLAAWTAWLRLPFVFPAVINWDESTFVLMGQSVLDGHLPYLELWDLKPPLAFVAVAGFIAVFGKSVAAIRVGGWLATLATVWLVHASLKRGFGRGTGLLAGALTALFISAQASGQATMTEHLALAPAMFAIWRMATRSRVNAREGALIGAALGIASMVRVNLAAIAIAVGLLLVWRAWRPREGESVSLGGIGAYAGAGLAVVGLTALPYGVAGELDTWWHAVFAGSLHYTQAQYGVWETIRRQMETLLSQPNLWLTIAALAAAVWLVVRRVSGRCGADEARALGAFAAFAIATALSIALGGVGHAHYLIQLVPALTMAAALGAAALIRAARAHPVRLFAVAWLALFVCASALTPIVREYDRLADRWQRGQPLQHGSAFEIAEVIRERGRPAPTLYALHDHIVYWLIDAVPPSPVVTHPSNLSKTYLYPFTRSKSRSAAELMREIVAKRPDYIIKRRRHWYLDQVPAAKRELMVALRRDYEAVERVDGRTIYERRATLPPSRPR